MSKKKSNSPESHCTNRTLLLLPAYFLFKLLTKHFCNKENEMLWCLQYTTCCDTARLYCVLARLLLCRPYSVFLAHCYEVARVFYIIARGCLSGVVARLMLIFWGWIYETIWRIKFFWNYIFSIRFLFKDFFFNILYSQKYLRMFLSFHLKLFLWQK